MLRRTLAHCLFLAAVIVPLAHEGRALAGQPGPAPRGKVIVAATRQFPRNGEGSFLKRAGGKLVYFYGAWPTTSDSARETCIVEHAPGKLLMVLHTLRGWLYQSRSEDDGRTWSRPVRSSVANPRAPARLEKIPGTGAILMVHNPHVSGEGWHKGARVVLAARTSRDGGRTWSDPRQIEHTGAGTWYDYPSVYWTGDVLHLAYRSVPRGGKGPKRVDVRYQRLNKAWLLGGK